MSLPLLVYNIVHMYIYMHVCVCVYIRACMWGEIKFPDSDFCFDKVYRRLALMKVVRDSPAPAARRLVMYIRTVVVLNKIFDHKKHSEPCNFFYFLFVLQTVTER